VTSPRPALRRASAALAALFFLLVSGDAAAAAKKRKRGPDPTPVPRPADPYRVTITTADGVALAASFRPVEGDPKAPGVLLIHDFSRERRELEPLADELHARGFTTLSFDLRAHGESTKKGAVTLAISPTLLRDPAGFPRDVEAAAAWLKTRAPRTAALGFSTGGYLALIASSARQVDAVVAVSVSDSRLIPLAGGKTVTPRGALLLACELDPGRADSAKRLLAAAEEPKKLLLFPGGAHNLAVMREHPEAKQAAFEWLAGRLGATLPPAPAPSPAPK
jgi:alpha-beta hydrolase superfamily lysophospholipase